MMNNIANVTDKAQMDFRVMSDAKVKKHTIVAPRYRDDDPRYRNDDRRYQDDYDYREDYRRRNDEYDEDGNRYYNDRDFRREQQLEEENEKIRNLKMANCYYCNTVDYRSGICHKSNT